MFPVSYICPVITEQQDKWLGRVEDIFLRYGIKSFTMDDVARALGISKKTLYQFVENKDDLVAKVMERHMAMHCAEEKRLFAQATDALEQMISVLEHILQNMHRLKPNVIFELQKYHRPIWEAVQQHQRTHIATMMRANIVWGQRDGLYRTDFDIDILIRFYLASSFSVFDEETFPKPPYSFETLFRENILNFLYSVTSETGRTHLRQKIGKTIG